MALKNRNRAARALRNKVLVAAAVCAAPTAVFAQTAGDDSGLRIGSGRLNPVFEFETAYDSAAGVVDNETAGDMILHIRPGLRFVAPSEKMQLSLKAFYDYQAYMGAENEALTDQSKSTADIDFGAMFNRDGNVRFEITNRFVRSDRTSNLSLGVNSISNRNDAALRMTAIEKGAWSVTPSYTLTVESFDQVQEALPAAFVDRYNYLRHTGGLEARYAIGGNTAILFDGSVGYRTYTADEADLQRQGLTKADDRGSFHAMVGLTGRVMPKVGYTLKAGYGSQFGLGDAEDGEKRGFNSLVGGAELAWNITELSEVRLGYARTFESDPYYDFYSDDRVYVESALAFTTQLGLRAGLSYDAVTFGTGEVGGSDERKDGIFAFHVGPEYRFNRWFSGGLRYGVTSRSAEDGNVDSNSLYNYDRHELSARVMFVY